MAYAAYWMSLVSTSATSLSLTLWQFSLIHWHQKRRGCFLFIVVNQQNLSEIESAAECVLKLVIGCTRYPFEYKLIILIALPIFCHTRSVYIPGCVTV